METLKLPVNSYYNIPPCPKCGSRRTGRYIREPSIPLIEGRDSRDYTIKECLLHGELVRLAPHVPLNNAYCEDCGYEWKQDVRVSIVPRSRIDEEIEARGTMKAYNKYREENPKRKKTIFGKIFGFLP